jgi:hypothetical protein
MHIENGPCHFYGNDTESPETAAPFVWNLLQHFYMGFPDYENHDLSVRIEVYGEHYDHMFASHILEQNTIIG